MIENVAFLFNHETIKFVILFKDNDLSLSVIIIMFIITNITNMDATVGFLSQDRGFFEKYVLNQCC